MLRTAAISETIHAPYEHNFHLKLSSKAIQIGRDGSVIRKGEGVYEILSRRCSRALQFQDSDFDHGHWHVWVTFPLYEKWTYSFIRSDTIISMLRGPVVRAVRRLQRAFREKRYMQRYEENKGWDNFVDCVVAWVECGGRYFGKSKFSPFSPTPTWGYAPAPAIEAAPSSPAWDDPPDPSRPAIPSFSELLRIKARNHHSRAHLEHFAAGDPFFLGTFDVAARDRQIPAAAAAREVATGTNFDPWPGFLHALETRSRSRSRTRSRDRRLGLGGRRD